MLPQMFDTTTVPVLEQVLQFAQTRHQLLASNVANLDTPGYRVRDLSPERFETRLASAIEARDRNRQSVASAHLVRGGSDPIREVGRNLEGILQHDDSNVGIEQQVNELAKNHIQHNLAISLLEHQFQLLKVAISERP